MKSAYGLTIPKEDEELTHVGSGTPCGELLRRYWHPVCLSEDLKDLPKSVRILGEELIAFRDGRGNPGLFFFRCSHRGTSLEYGRIEERGIRCCYHGWLYDVEGNILEMPLEPEDSPYKNHIQHPCYPVKEFGGLVFAYMGPPDRIPELPRYDVWLKDGGALKARVGPRVGGAVNCNWLQSQENLMDALHTQWLHTAHSGPQFPSDLYAKKPKRLVYEETELGMRFIMTHELADGGNWEVIWDMFMPMTAFISYSGEPVTAKPRQVAFCIPVDDTHQIGASIRWVPLHGGESEMRGHKDFGPLSRKDTSYEYTQRYPDDKEAQEGQGPIAIHALEHMVNSDEGVRMFRKILRDSINAVKDGKDPKGVIRDSEKSKCIPTTAGSVIK